MAFLELNKDKNLRRDETPFEEQIGNYWGDSVSYTHLDVYKRQRFGDFSHEICQRFT